VVLYVSFCARGCRGVGSAEGKRGIIHAIGGVDEQLARGVSLVMADEGVLDDQFEQLCQLQDEENENFVREVVDMFFIDGAKKMSRVAELLVADVPAFRQLEDTVHALKGSSASVGACQVVRECSAFRLCCEAADKGACVASYEKIVQLFERAKVALEARIAAGVGDSVMR